MSKPPSLHRMMALALALTMASTLLMAGALFGYRLYCVGSEARSLRLHTLTSTVAVAAAHAASWPEDRQDAMWSALTAREPELVAVRLLDHAGSILFERGDTGIFEGEPAKAWPGRSSGFTQWRGLAVRTSDRVGGVSVGLLPLRDPIAAFGGGACLVGLADGSPSGAAMREAWILFVSLLGLGAAGMLLGGALLKIHLLLPLRQLSDHVVQTLQCGEGPTLPTDRDDEIGRLARVFQEMQKGLREWRTRATRLEYTMDRRVSVETRRIQSQLKHVERKAWTDPLTGLGNRRLFDEKIDEIFTAQQEAGKDLAVVMIDLDHFKQLNDQLGHSAGDDLLHFAGELLRQCLRVNDLAIRLGGDEFLLILPSSSSGDAAAVAQRLVRLFSQRALLINSIPKPSMSAGVASMWQTRAETAATLIRYADESLYQAKRAGKGCVIVHEPVEEPAQWL